MTYVESAPLDDATMLHHMVRRDPESVALLYDRYGGVAFTLAYRILNDRQSAEDTVQESFLNAWRRVATYDARRGTVRTWLLTIVHHQTISLLRATRSRGGATIDIASILSLTNGEDTVATVVRGMHGEQVREALGALSSVQRQVVELAYFGGLSLSEISRSSAVPLGTVKGRMRLGLAKLRATMPQWDEI